MVTSWLITGGCGFIGTSLIQALLKINSSINIRIFDNLSVGSREDLAEVCEFQEILSFEIKGAPKGIELVVGDIRDVDQAVKVAQGIECIVHLAANTGVGPSVENPRIDMESNVFGTFNMLEAARVCEVNKFIFASSGAPIGDLSNPPIHEELPAHPVSPYGASKLAGEGYCSAYHKTFGIDTIALRFGNVYGPRSKHKASVVAKFIKLALDSQICEIYGDGRQTRDFIYIDDLIAAIIKACKVHIGGEVFQIATNKESTVNEVAEIIKSQLAKENIQMNLSYGEVRIGDVLRNFSDTSKAKEKLGWEPRQTLEAGIRSTVRYFIS
jgi:UDP-glucose 4-epimerase